MAKCRVKLNAEERNGMIKHRKCLLEFNAEFDRVPCVGEFIETSKEISNGAIVEHVVLYAKSGEFDADALIDCTEIS
jgi:hypothetical protein